MQRTEWSAHPKGVPANPLAIPAARYDIELAVRLVPEGSGTELRGMSLNLSESGVLVLTDRLEPNDTRVQTAFQAFTSTSEVVWTREADETGDVLLGMKSVSLSRKDRKSLLSLLRNPPRT